MDQLIFSYLHNWAGRSVLVDLLSVFLADYLPYLLVLAFIILIFANRRRIRRFYFIFLSALSLLIARGLITEAIRFFYPRPRPFLVLDFQALITHPGSAAFPSGHAVTFFVLATVVFFMDSTWLSPEARLAKGGTTSRKYFYYFLGGATLNALARVYVGVHWPTDVLAGALIGVITVIALHKFLPKANT